VSRERSYIRSVDGRWGRCYFFDQDEYIGKSLASYGEYSPDETEFILRLAEKSGREKRVLDVGANIGAISQALEHSGYTVEAFEPQPEVFGILTANFKGKAHNVALGDVAGTTTMPRVLYNERNNFGALSCGSASRLLGAMQVRVERLDSYHYEDVGLMKIDVEGYEELVLRGAAETIDRCSPILYVEDDRPRKSEGLHRFIAELGYRWERHDPPLYRAQNFLGRQENVWDRNYVSGNIVCYR
jgi:FkbM family methyltransferase